MLGQLFCGVIIFIVYLIRESGATCTTNSGGVKTFGPNCEYICHCKSDWPCDTNTGDCSNGCDTKWYGPGCQFRDLAENEESHHLDNKQSNRSASRANDGNMDTCSSTNVATSTRTRNPWWRVQFKQNEIIQSMVFVTREDQLHYFKGFKVTVENAPASKATDEQYYPPAFDVHLCFQHSNFAPSNKSIHVACDQPLEGNLVRIQLARNDTQLVLCDVKINGGRNLAFMKTLEYSSPYDDGRYPSRNAVDGVLRNNAREYCFTLRKNSTETADRLTVNLGHLSIIKGIRITTFSGYSEIRYYQLYISNTTGAADAELVHDDTGYSPSLKVTLQTTGQFVTLKRTYRSLTTICELEIYGDCTVGKCGYDCSKDCRCKIIDDKISGVCTSGCEGRWTGPGNECTNNCSDFQWGENCENQCGQCRDSKSCDVVNGYCPFGCHNGYVDIPRCNIGCPNGTYGRHCSLTCPINCRHGDVCNKSNGNCEGGCIAGYQGNMCEEECPVGSYGIECSGICVSSCRDLGKCNKTNGHCISCGAGEQGAYCDEGCDDKSYGEDCSKQCGACANNEPCNKVSGQCSGCDKGFKHSLLCQEECDDGSYGKNCTGVCGNCKPGTVCDKVTRVCHFGCSEKFTGSFCIEASKAFPIGGVVGGVIAFIVVVVTAVVVLLILRRRKAQLEHKSASHTGIDKIPTQGKDVNAGSVRMNTIYENSSEIEAELASQNSTNKENEVGIYYKEEPIVKHRSGHSILVSDLKDYVKKRTADTKYFLKEFQKLPSGLQYPTSVAKKPGNTGKNRNRAICAYDHSRVVLKTLAGQRDSDYINATFIKGHFKDKAYIAAQDPIDFTLVDFWRMIWEKDVYTIVMVTGQEETKIKCAQYWTEAEDSVQHGNINIRTVSVDISAEFTVRHLKVSHQDSPDSARNITQFHYTRWLNEDAPLGTTSLLHFWYQVRKHDGQKKHPWLVHCSNGVGCIGSFIALDILYDQGKEQGCVDVFGCVRDLRAQRVSMVQTKEEYIYLHNMLVEVLVLPSKPVHVDEIPALYIDLQEIDQDTGRTKAKLHYETLLDDNDDGNEYAEIY